MKLARNWQLKIALILALSAFIPTQAAENQTPAAPKVGIVDLRRCLNESKFGQQQRTSFMAMQKQLATDVEKIERELMELDEKSRDPEFRDSLSPKEEENFMIRGQSLGQELQQAQNHYYQMMSQGEAKIMQDLTTHVMRASQIVSRDMGLDYVMRQDACFFFAPSSEITDRIITEMDKLFAVESGIQKS